MRPFSRSAKQASLFCSRLIKWLFLKCLSYIVCKDTICHGVRKHFSTGSPWLLMCRSYFTMTFLPFFT